MYDAIVVGARCAGAPLAMLLARGGAKVLLVDRATFPSDIPHGHFIHRHGPRRLRQWGVLDAVAMRTPAITSAIVDLGDFPLLIRDLVEDGLPWAYAPRRATLDHSLVQAAVVSGAEVRERFNVDEYIVEDGSVVGVRARTADGRPIEERAPLTIGADGRNSRLARAVHAPVYNDVPAILCYYFSYWQGVESEDFEMYVRGEARRVVFSFKTEDHAFGVFVGFPVEQFAQVRGDIEGAFMSAVDAIPGFGGRIRAGRRVERFYGASDLPNFYRKPYGAGWALVGDAGLHKDPLLALGICDALRDVEFLADAVADGLGGRAPLPAALAEYERRRNEASAADYTENIAAARFTPLPPRALAIRAAVRNLPREATRFWKARAGMIDPGEFFNPANLERLFSADSGASV
jgi:2-polyprenyl-6-methoxyphenol hydroxylase-like FAD-dependent oxidoreductase